MNPGGDVTRLLSAWAEGDEHALQELMPLGYQELHRIAQYHWSGQPGFSPPANHVKPAAGGLMSAAG